MEPSSAPAPQACWVAWIEAPRVGNDAPDKRAIRNVHTLGGVREGLANVGKDVQAIPERARTGMEDRHLGALGGAAPQPSRQWLSAGRRAGRALRGCNARAAEQGSAHFLGTGSWRSRSAGGARVARRGWLVCRHVQRERAARSWRGRRTVDHALPRHRMADPDKDRDSTRRGRRSRLADSWPAFCATSEASRNLSGEKCPPNGGSLGSWQGRSRAVLG